MRRIGSLLLLCAFLSTLHSAQVFSLYDVRPNMERLFHHHVEYKEMSPLLVRRSLQLYLERFDPHRLYFLQKEVTPFLGPTAGQVEKVIDDFYHDQFPLYLQLTQLIEHAIGRYQGLKEEEWQSLLGDIEALKQGVWQKVEESPLGYAASEEELRGRIRGRICLEIRGQLEGREDLVLTPVLAQKIFEFRAKKAHAFEKQYTAPSEHTLALHILKAMAKSLDAHTGYYSPLEAYELRTALKKEFSGVGVVLLENFDGVQISSLLARGPAERSGKICPGDSLLAIDGHQVEELTFEEVLEQMKGEAGSVLHLVLRRGEQRLLVELVRELMTIDHERLSISSVPNGMGLIGKVEVPAFYDNGGWVSLEHDLREGLHTLKRAGELQGIVLDFRDNSGGFLNQAIKVASLFIQGGLIVISKYANSEVTYQRNVDGMRYFEGPMVVLISKGSASAAEIVAQALQDYGIALIVGDERSYGKGSIQYQTITNEKAKTFFKVTVGRYYTASGRSPQILGVQSDIVVPTALAPHEIGERYLHFPLSGDHLGHDLFWSLMHATQGGRQEARGILVPYLHPLESKWRRMLPRLIANSRARIERNKNFQWFLHATNLAPNLAPNLGPKQVQTKHPGEVGEKVHFGQNDLQMEEAIEILKDMIVISQTSQGKGAFPLH